MKVLFGAQACSIKYAYTGSKIIFGAVILILCLMRVTGVSAQGDMGAAGKLIYWNQFVEPTVYRPDLNFVWVGGGYALTDSGDLYNLKLSLTGDVEPQYRNIAKAWFSGGLLLLTKDGQYILNRNHNVSNPEMLYINGVPIGFSRIIIAPQSDGGIMAQTADGNWLYNKTDDYPGFLELLNRNPDLVAAFDGSHILKSDGTIESLRSLETRYFPEPMPENILGLVMMSSDSVAVWHSGDQVDYAFRRNLSPGCRSCGDTIRFTYDGEPDSITALTQSPVAIWLDSGKIITLHWTASDEEPISREVPLIGLDMLTETTSHIFGLARSPQVLEPATTIEGFVTRSIRIEADYLSAESVAISWFKDGELLENQSGGELIIDELSYDDAGAYTYRVENEHGFSDSRPIVLTVLSDDLNLGSGYHPVSGKWATSSGESGWRLDLQEETPALVSGPAADEGESKLTLNIEQGSRMFLMFEYRISSEEFCDVLKIQSTQSSNITILGAGPFSGDIGWTTAGIVLRDGPLTVDFIYSKDKSNSAGQDRAWIRNVRVIPYTDSSSLQSIYVVNGGDDLDISFSPEFTELFDSKIRDLESNEIVSSGKNHVLTGLLDSDSGLYQIEFDGPADIPVHPFEINVLRSHPKFLGNLLYSAYVPGFSLELFIPGGEANPVAGKFYWYADGVEIPGQHGPTLNLEPGMATEIWPEYHVSLQAEDGQFHVSTPLKMEAWDKSVVTQTAHIFGSHYGGASPLIENPVFYQKGSWEAYIDADGHLYVGEPNSGDNWSMFDDRIYKNMVSGEGLGLAVTVDNELSAWGSPENLEKLPIERTGIAGIAVFANSPIILYESGKLYIPENVTRHLEIDPDGPIATESFKSIDASDHILAALTGDGSLIQWSANTIPHPDETRFGSTELVSISVGNYHGLALDAEGNVLAWGQNQFGQLNLPPDSGVVAAIMAVNNTSLAMLEDGSLVQWGKAIRLPSGFTLNDEWYLAPLKHPQSGEDSASLVRRTPIIIEASRSVSAEPGSMVTFEIQQKGGTDFRWYRGDKLLAETNVPTFSIGAVDDSHYGLYRVEAVNRFGITSVEGMVLSSTETGQNGIPLTVSSVNDDLGFPRFKFTSAFEHTDGAEYHWFINQMPAARTDSPEWVMDAGTQAHFAQFRRGITVQVISEREGTSAASNVEVFTFTGFPKPDEIPARLIMAREGYTHLIFLPELGSASDYTIEWKKDGTPIDHSGWWYSLGDLTPEHAGVYEVSYYRNDMPSVVYRFTQEIRLDLEDVYPAFRELAENPGMTFVYEGQEPVEQIESSTPDESPLLRLPSPLPGYESRLIINSHQVDQVSFEWKSDSDDRMPMASIGGYSLEYISSPLADGWMICEFYFRSGEVDILLQNFSDDGTGLAGLLLRNLSGLPGGGPYRPVVSLNDVYRARIGQKLVIPTAPIERLAGSPPFDSIFVRWIDRKTSSIHSESDVFIIDSVGPEHLGTWSASYIYSPGESVFHYKEFEIETVDPWFRVQPSDLTVQDGRQLEISVEVDGEGPMVFKWKRGGLTFAETDGPRIVLDSVEFCDGGIYTVEVSNEYGSSESSPFTVSVVGKSNFITFGELENLSIPEPDGPLYLKDFAVSPYHVVGSKFEGGLAVWGGDNSPRRLNRPSFGLVTSSRVFEQLASSRRHSAVVAPDGFISTWGESAGRIRTPTGVPVESVFSGYDYLLYTDIFGAGYLYGNIDGLANWTTEGSGPFKWLGGGESHIIGLQEDGRVIAWGNGDAGQHIVPENAINIGRIAAGARHNLALDESGKLIAWGDNSMGQTDIPETSEFFIDIAAGDDFSVAVTSTGRLLAWGNVNREGSVVQIPEGIDGVERVLAAGQFLLAKIGKPILTQFDCAPRIVESGDTLKLSAGFYSEASVNLQWYKDGEELTGKTSMELTLDTITGEDFGEYFLKISNRFGNTFTPPITVGNQNNPIELSIASDAGQIILSWINASGDILIEYSGDLKSWTPLPDNEVSQNGESSITIQPDDTHRFYRVRGFE